MFKIVAMIPDSNVGPFLKAIQDIKGTVESCVPVDRANRKGKIVQKSKAKAKVATPSKSAPDWVKDTIVSSLGSSFSRASVVDLGKAQGYTVMSIQSGLNKLVAQGFIQRTEKKGEYVRTTTQDQVRPAAAAAAG